jgi:hypothetical protein
MVTAKISVSRSRRIKTVTPLSSGGRKKNEPRRAARLAG